MTGDRIRSDEDLKKGIERVAHSLESLGYAETWLSVAGVDHPSWNAHVESFLMHARKLAEFLDPLQNIRPDDVRPSDFVKGDGHFPVDIDHEVRNQLNKRLAHFTYAPVPNEEPNMEWPITQMAEALREAMTRFTDELVEQDGSERSERMKRAWERSQPFYRKPVL